MLEFFSELNKRNKLLFWFGFFNIISGFICLGLLISSHQTILGVNAWSKPLKYYFSTAITVWSIGWMIYHLHSKSVRAICSFLITIALLAETSIVTLQSVRGVPSHFNDSDPFNLMLHSLLLLMILMFSLVMIYVTISLFMQKKMPISQHYTWGIRLGMLVFVVFTLAGGYMYRIMKHTVGGEDGGAGLPFVNWSTQFGDLRVAHFLAVHALQVIPLVSYYFLEKKRQVIRFSILYSILIIVLYVLALMKIPLVP